MLGDSENLSFGESLEISLHLHFTGTWSLFFWDGEGGFENLVISGNIRTFKTVLWRIVKLCNPAQ